MNWITVGSTLLVSTVNKAPRCANTKRSKWPLNRTGVFIFKVVAKTIHWLEKNSCNIKSTYDKKKDRKGDCVESSRKRWAHSTVTYRILPPVMRLLETTSIQTRCESLLEPKSWHLHVKEGVTVIGFGLFSTPSFHTSIKLRLCKLKLIYIHIFQNFRIF